MTPPLLSIVLNVRNAQRFIPGMLAQLEAALALESTGVLAAGSLEILLVDDASTDASAQLLSEWARGRAAVKMLHRFVCTGVSAAREAALHSLTGAYVWFIDVDDEIDAAIIPLVLQELAAVDSAAEAAVESAVEVVCFRAQQVSATGRVRLMEGVAAPVTWNASQAAVGLLRGQVRGFLWNKVFKAELLRRCLPFPALSSQSDFALVLACIQALAPEARLRMLPQIGYYYRPCAGSITATDPRQIVNTAQCAAAAVPALVQLIQADAATARRVDLECLVQAFMLWFYVLPGCLTPIHRRWEPALARQVLRVLLPELRAGRVLAAARVGYRRKALHAVVLRVLYPLGLYRLAWLVVRKWLQ